MKCYMSPSIYHSSILSSSTMLQILEKLCTQKYATLSPESQHVITSVIATLLFKTYVTRVLSSFNQTNFGKILETNTEQICCMMRLLHNRLDIHSYIQKFVTKTIEENPNPVFVQWIIDVCGQYPSISTSPSMRITYDQLKLVYNKVCDVCPSTCSDERIFVNVLAQKMIYHNVRMAFRCHAIRNIHAQEIDEIAEKIINLGVCTEAQTKIFIDGMVKHEFGKMTVDQIKKVSHGLLC